MPRHIRFGARVALVLGVLLVPWRGAIAQQEERNIEAAIRTAETDTDYSYRTKIDSALSVSERSMFDIGGYLNFTAIFLTDSTNNYRRLFAPEITLYGRAVIDGAHQFFVRSRFVYDDYSPGDSFDGKGSRWDEPFLDRYWYEFDSRRAIESSKGVTPNWDINVRAGRQFVNWGGGLALSEVLYAARPTFTFGRLDIEGMAGVTPPDESIVDFDASRADYNSNTLRGFFGGLLRYTTKSNHEFYAYGLYMPDYNDSERAAFPQGIGPVDFKYEATYVGIGADGSFSPQWLYAAEFVYEFGTSQSDPLRAPQRSEDISAWAATAQLTWLFRDAGRSSITFETVLASGDDDRLNSTDTVGGNKRGTTDHGYNSLGFASTGLAFAPSVSNIMLFRVGGKTTPFAEHNTLNGIQIGGDVTVFNKLSSDAPIDQPTTDDTYLGIETDVYFNYRITSDLTFIARCGLFFPSDTIESSAATKYFVFLGWTLSF